MKRGRCGAGEVWRAMVAMIFALPGATGEVAATPERAEVLRTLGDSLRRAQITAAEDPNFGALVCPSTNPALHPLHSRAGEAVYPLAVLYSAFGDAADAEAARRLGNWLVGLQEENGAWFEAWPTRAGWVGTTVDQLISLAGAYPLLEARLSEAERVAWRGAIRRAAEFTVERWPMGNLNYWSTGAVGLVYASRAVEDAPEAWRGKARELIDMTLAATNADGLLVGEGRGVDVGYNLAQTIGFVALYGRLTGDEAVLDAAAALLRTHLAFVLPNGAVDNSWGTRSYKWTYESGTKTAPGIHFTLALLEDRDPEFGRVADRALEFLVEHALVDGWVTQGPHAARRASAFPPCLYGTFARAQSLAMALRHAPARGREVEAESAVTMAASGLEWRHFPTVNVVVVSTAEYAATVAAYGEISVVKRDFVPRGGSLTTLWWEGYGPTGFLQTSSVTDYRRQELIHMPFEEASESLTPRVEWVDEDGRRWSNLYEAEATMEVRGENGAVEVIVRGKLRDAEGAAGPGYRLGHRFTVVGVEKTVELEGVPRGVVQVVEPIVRIEGLVVNKTSEGEVLVGTAGGDRTWVWRVREASAPGQWEADETVAWQPFPAVEARSLRWRGRAEADGRFSLRWTVERP